MTACATMGKVKDLIRDYLEEYTIKIERKDVPTKDQEKLEE